MFCLRSFLVLLFIPLNASPIFIVTFFILTYLLNRPCVYCSILLVILFASSCYWSDQCFFDLSGNWFEPRRLSTEGLHNACLASTGASGSDCPSEADLILGAINDTARALLGAAGEEAKRLATSLRNDVPAADTHWARSWLGTWRIPCLDVNIRL